MTKSTKHVVQLDGKSYTWNGNGWCGPDNAVPPKIIVDTLNRRIATQLEIEDLEIADADELIKVARDAQKAGQKNRALNLASRAYQLQPSAGTAAVYCSYLRSCNKPAEALEVADRFSKDRYPPILTSRAAALCDLERWEEGLKQIRQVLAICHASGKDAGEALSVFGRIKSDKPHLLKPR